MRDQALAILWAQWRSVRNYLPKSDSATVLTVLIGLVWYGLWTGGAVAVALICLESSQVMLQRFLPGTLLLGLLYWQTIPILMASTGHSLEIRKLIVYPIVHSELFALEVLLRVTAAAEMIIMSVGAFIGLALNRSIPFWAPASILLFIVFNLALSAGLRDLLGRLLARRRIRELMVLVFVMMAAVPQLLLQRGDPNPDRIRTLVRIGSLGDVWPWVAFAHFASASHVMPAIMSTLLWTAAALWFGRWQFERNLRFDSAAAQSSVDRRPEGSGFAEKLFRIPSFLFSGQLSAMVEKELRFLVRAPRFRLVFIMSFTFGLMIWLPIFLRPGRTDSMRAHFLTAVMAYGVMLLSEVTVWNVFGFDRSAVQMYYAAPVTIRSVLVAKNIAAAAFILIDGLIMITVCSIVPVHITADAILEAVSVTAVVSLFIISIGNMISMRNPRPVDPSQSWRRTSAGRVQAFLILVYLLVAAPVALAYGAQYAFESDIAFYLVLLVDLGIGAILYWLGMDSAVETALSRKEAIITALSQGQGPVA